MSTKNQRLDFLAAISGVMIALQARANGEHSHLIGKGDEALTTQELLWLADFQLWRDGLIELGLKTERRLLRLVPQGLTIKQEDSTTLVIEFALAKGCFATALLRELVLYRDASPSHKEQEEEQ